MKSQSTDHLNSFQQTTDKMAVLHSVDLYCSSKPQLAGQTGLFNLRQQKDSALAIPVSDNPNRFTEVFHN